MAVFDVSIAELQIARKIFWLLKWDYIFLTGYNDEIEYWDEGAYPAISCNELYVPAADSEKLEECELDAYIAVVRRWGRAGSIAWCALKRNRKIWMASRDKEEQEKIDEAIKSVPETYAQYVTGKTLPDSKENKKS